MSNRLIAVVEGKTEKAFVDRIIAPALWCKGVYMEATILKKPGENGGDVRFSRVQKDVTNLLRQDIHVYVTTFIDFYGIKDPHSWPGLDEAKKKTSPEEKSSALLAPMHAKICDPLADIDAHNRFIPYVALHEVEALLFSNADLLATALRVSLKKIETILRKCGEPENINDSSLTAPSKRLESLSSRFKKTTTGISLAEKIGLCTMREKCPIFNAWLERIEQIGDN